MLRLLISGPSPGWCGDRGKGVAHHWPHAARRGSGPVASLVPIHTLERAKEDKLN
jgi:hypothetical protein